MLDSNVQNRNVQTWVNNMQQVDHRNQVVCHQFAQVLCKGAAVT